MNIIKNISIKTGYVIFTCFILLMLIFPIFYLGNYAEPLILGMPFIMAWVVFWIVVEFLGLVFFVKFDKDVED